MLYRRLGCVVAIATASFAVTQSAMAQTTTNNIDAPSNATSTANPVVDLNQAGSLVNTQVNTFPLGRSVVGNGVADCTRSGIAFSAFGNGNGPFDTGNLGGSLTYTHSFGVGDCKKYAKVQLAKSKLETCLLLISNYSKMTKAGIDVSYQALKGLTGVNCPNVALPGGVGGGNLQPQSTGGGVFVPTSQSQQLQPQQPLQQNSQPSPPPAAQPLPVTVPPVIQASQPLPNPPAQNTPPQNIPAQNIGGPQLQAPQPQGPIAVRQNQAPANPVPQSQAPQAQNSQPQPVAQPAQASGGTPQNVNNASPSVAPVQQNQPGSGTVGFTYGASGDSSEQSSNENSEESDVYSVNSTSQNQGVVARSPQQTVLDAHDSSSVHREALSPQGNSSNGGQRQPKQGPVFIQY